MLNVFRHNAFCPCHMTSGMMRCHDQIARSMFPLGPLTKADVRKMAAAAGLATQGRKDSQGHVCQSLPPSVCEIGMPLGLWSAAVYVRA